MRIKDLREPDLKDKEDLAAVYLIDASTGFELRVYECQVREAERILRPFVDGLVDIGIALDKMAEHARRVGANQSEAFNQRTIEISDEALLLVGSSLPYESYVVSGLTSEPEVIGGGVKKDGDLVRFDSMRLSTVMDDELNVIVQAEIIEIQPESRPTTYNRIVFKPCFDPENNPEGHRIALMELDTPDISIS